MVWYAVVFAVFDVTNCYEVMHLLIFTNQLSGVYVMIELHLNEVGSANQRNTLMCRG